MKILAIESSCDDTGIAIVEDGRKILTSKVSSQVEKHKLFGGVVPEVASRKHIEMIVPLLHSVFEESRLSFKDLDSLAVTYGPGLVGSLLVGLNFAKGLSLASNLPLIPVHHIKGHIASLYLSNQDLKPPFLCLVVSGGHTCILEVLSYTRFKTLAQTRDDAAGEAFDKIGRRLGLDYPGGVALDKLAEKGNPNSFKLPIPFKENSETYDFSFSGIKTAMINIINNLSQHSDSLPIEDLAASFRETVVKCLLTNFIKLASNYKYTSLGIAGGVSANSLLRLKLEEECYNRKLKLFKPKLELCGDNAAMIGAQAYYEFLDGNISTLDLNAHSNLSI